MSQKFLSRIADALERISPPNELNPDFSVGNAFLWNTTPDSFQVIESVNHVDLDLLLSLDRARDTLLQNTYQFAKGFPANNALLWGARGMGKSSLVKAICVKVQSENLPIKLIEIQREDLPSIGRLLSYIRDLKERFILFCDDLSFSNDDGTSRQESGAPSSVSGSYSFFTPEGELVDMQYTADEFGFHTSGSHMPTTPPPPPHVQRMLDHLHKVNGGIF